MKLGLIEIETAYLGNIQLNSSNAFIGTTPLIDSSTLPEPALDYFYLQPLTTGNYSVSTSDEVWKQNNTFEFSLNKTSWRQFSSLAHQDTSVGFDVYMTNNPDLVALALDINAYNTYVVGQNYRVGISQMGPVTVATFLGTDENFAYYAGTLEYPEMMDFEWGLMTATSTSLIYRSEYSEDRMFEWDGTDGEGTNTNISDYSSFNVVTATITETIPLTANDKLYLRNTSGSIHSGIINSIQSVNYNIGGILNTLTDYTDDTYTITTSYADGLFKGDTHLISAGDLELPATTLADYCYLEMFYGCTALTTAPTELPATTLANSCYSSMFYGCSSLASTPELPATRLAERCYSSMFLYCSRLTSAPELPATTLANYCYGYMFYGCSSLTSAPELPATRLANGCYSSMFAGCSNINYIKCLGTNSIQVAASSGWLNNVATSGTFEGDSSLIADWSYGSSGVPDGWTEIGINRNLFRLECESGSATIGINQKSSKYTGEYSIDNGVSWTPISTSILIPLSQGESVAFRGKLTANNSDSNYTLFKKTNDNSSKINAKGMLFYFLKKDGNNNNSTNYKYEATYLFSSSSNGVNIVDASDLILFNNVAQYGYFRMFYGCSSLTSAPELPATRLAIDCYSFMFLYCSSLTSAPVLPATTLVSGCYKYMFNPCNSLNKVITYANDISANLALYEWIGGVSATGDFYNLGGATFATGSSGIPSGWTEHTSL